MALVVARAATDSATVKRCYAELVTDVDDGFATRSAGSTRLRNASNVGDMEKVAECLGERMAPHIDAPDEYGRSALFLAAREGHLEVVRLLLSHGASPFKAAHGGWLPWDVADMGGHGEVAALLPPNELCPHWRQVASTSTPPIPTTTVLLSSEEGLHPGAGTAIIDDSLTETDLKALITLWRSLPVASKDKASPIDRGYYDDVDGFIGRLLSDAIIAAKLPIPTLNAPSQTLGVEGVAVPIMGYPNEHNDTINYVGASSVELLNSDSDLAKATKSTFTNCRALPLMRFLCYPEAGGALPVHVDLPRIAESDGNATAALTLHTNGVLGEGESMNVEKKASVKTTHSFLLYLMDCAVGGETLLLEV
jgi:hypothetical protein